ncbi:MAG: transglycosylase SLT domain-containing protein [Nitrospirae bacterium]|nr:transglycosylase SLT domain-containing protein [Nitrospirota bacterium]
MAKWLKLILRCAAVILVLGLAGVSGASAASENRFSLPESPLFSCPAPLRPQVDFWIKIFTMYTTKQAVIHDNRYLNIIYSVVDLTEDQSNSKKARIGVLSFEISKYREILLKLDKLKPDDPDEINNLSPEESRVYEMFRGIEGANKFSEAAERLRAQIGQKDRFQKALSKSTLYLKEMERIFREEGVPVALTRLPFVESSFDVSAYSWAKAAGIWQFTDSTGRIFLRMNSIVDERIDPEKSTRAAARLLLDNYAQLGSWPLAVTAYNHGASGLSRAKKDLSTSDISEIVEKYKGPSFGFASRNYYTEFLAVLEILEDYQSYFGDVEFMYPKEYEVLRTGRSMKVSAIAAACSLEEIKRLNPELKPSVMASKTSLPCDYFLKLPPGTKDSLKSQVKTETPPPQAKPSTQTRKTDIASKSDASKKKESQPGKAIHIKPGEPLTAGIPKTDTKPKADTAKKPETSQSAPPKIEKKTPMATVTAKPTPDPKGDAKKSKPKPQIARHHKVITGQNLFSIAKMYNVSVKDLMKLNSIDDPSKVRPGRVLQIPAKS